MNSKAFIKLESVSKTFDSPKGKTEVIQNLSYNFEEGKIYTIIGPSGCGKSTIIRLILGLEELSKGDVEIGGLSPKDYQKTNKVGVVFQKASFFPWKTVKENILFPLQLAGNRITAENKIFASKLLEKFGIEETKDSYVHELSEGMQQRANVARALIMHPRLLILDEPFNSVDEFTREKLWAEFRDIWRRERLTVILISHDIREAVFFADELLVLPQKPISKIRSVSIELPMERSLDLLSSEEYFFAIQSVRRNLNFENV